jgi:hypothetical protein
MSNCVDISLFPILSSILEASGLIFVVSSVLLHKLWIM